MRRACHRSAVVAVLAALAAIAVACSVTEAIPGGDCSQSGECPQGLTCFPDWRCHAPGSTPDCDPPCYGALPLCLRSQLRCVACLGDGDCPSGTVCVPPNLRCLPGCSAAHPGCSSDATTCDVDLGACHGCLANADCPDPAHAHCDVGSGRCAACVAEPDSCPDGQYCSTGGDGQPTCTIGCKSAGDCTGSTNDCCGHRCVDTTTDGNNCGVCAFACPSGRSCCGGQCFDLSTSVDHCGSCAQVCEFPNVAGLRCMEAICSWTGCEFYFGDCDGNHANGCEANLTQDPDNCYGCNVRCPAPPHASPACSVAGCTLGPCLPGWADCNQQPGDGCEYDATGFSSDPRNCGACRQVCANNQQCKNGVCV